MFLHFSWITFDERKTHTTRVALFSYDVPGVWILMPCDFTIWTPSWTGTSGLKIMLTLAQVTIMSVSPRARIPSHRDFQISSRVNCFARSTRKGKVYAVHSKDFVYRCYSDSVFCTSFCEADSTAWNYCINKDVNKVSRRALVTSWFQNFPFHREKCKYWQINAPFKADRWPLILIKLSKVKRRN